METIELNQYNASFRIHGSEDRKSLEVKSIFVQDWPASGGSINLLVLDEKDMTIYSQLLDSSLAEGANLIVINKRFAFYDHLSVLVKAEPLEMPFSVVVNFE